MDPRCASCGRPLYLLVQVRINSRFGIGSRRGHLPMRHRLLLHARCYHVQVYAPTELERNLLVFACNAAACNDPSM